MFDRALLDSSSRRPRLAMLGGYVLEALLIGIAVLAPLIRMPALPPVLVRDLIPLSPPAAPASLPRAANASVHGVTGVNIFSAPRVIPRGIARLDDILRDIVTPPPQFAGVPGGAAGVGQGSVPFGGTDWRNVAPPPTPASGSQLPRRVVVGGVVEAAKLIHGPKPEYPPLARMVRAEGTVYLQAVIARDGTIQELKVLAGHPLLVKAAMDVVKQWRYQPTLLNGEPVEVLTEISVTFKLSD